MSILERYFKPPPNLERSFASEEDMRREYGYWRVRQLYTTFIGYAIYYFVRKNFSMAMPGMEKDLHFTKTTLGSFISIQDNVYGISKFVNGMIADRTNPRYFMALGLVLSALANFFFGLSSLPLVMGWLLICNGWFQGLGFPPVARVLSHWFSPGERGTMWGLWNTSHNVGLAGISILAGYLATYFGWRSVFVVPAVLAALVAIFIVERLRDTPGSLGLPPVEEYKGEEAAVSRVEQSEDFKAVLWRRVFSNPYIWIVCFANFFVYVIRYGFANWIPTYLKEMREVELAHGGWSLAAFEAAGVVGSLLAGWISDRWLRTGRAPVCVVYMLCTAAVIWSLWTQPALTVQGVNFHIWAIGFFDYGPQFLVGVMLADMATKEAAATAIGLSGLFGYLSSNVSGWGIGRVVDVYGRSGAAPADGWNAAFALLLACAVAGAFLFALCWKAGPPRPDGRNPAPTA